MTGSTCRQGILSTTPMLTSHEPEVGKILVTSNDFLQCVSEVLISPFPSTSRTKTTVWLKIDIYNEINLQLRSCKKQWIYFWLSHDMITPYDYFISPFHFRFQYKANFNHGNKFNPQRKLHRCYTLGCDTFNMMVFQWIGSGSSHLLAPEQALKSFSYALPMFRIFLKS